MRGIRTCEPVHEGSNLGARPRKGFTGPSPSVACPARWGQVSAASSGLGKRGLRQHGRMAGTTGEVELIGAGVYLVREGRIARVEFYANRGEALEALGLSAEELQGRRESSPRA
jgi:hypothetical protein